MNEETLQIRIHGDASLPTLIYLPGIHGDWTLIGSFKKAVQGRVRFVEFTYPRTLTWSLDDYAHSVISALRDNNIHEGRLLAESFGSQVAWAIIKKYSKQSLETPHEHGTVTPASQRRNRLQKEKITFNPSGVILAAGFVRHPVVFGAHCAYYVFRYTPRFGRAASLWIVKKYAALRHLKAPETKSEINEFIARRNDADWAAVTHRLDLVRRNDPRRIARTMNPSIPVDFIAGIVDPIVPYPPVIHWLKRHCPGFRYSKVISPADHNVLSTAPQKSAKIIMNWTSDKLR
ncbi:MAG: alpha/beta hydrolase [Verrucomicrobia bacterium]|nr:alpha/beta hydrolase [Verrucomicrobiota bacterium]